MGGRVDRIDCSCARRVAALALLALTLGSPWAVEESIAARVAGDASVEMRVGWPLERALRHLQSAGLRIVFTSELVTPDMRVVSVPRTRDLRAQLEALLTPHGLGVVDGPGRTVLVVRTAPRIERPAQRRGPPSTRPRAPASWAIEGAPEPAYREQVDVIAPHAEGAGTVTGLERRLSTDELHVFGSQVGDDPIRNLQLMPGVATGSDFRSELSVRGSAPRHAGVFVDGVSAPWLRHAASGRADTGDLSMIRSDMVQSTVLQVGNYVRRHGSQLGPQVEIALREGSRTDTRVEAGVSWTSTTLRAEGPVAGQRRGAWIVGVRKSHVEWPVGSPDQRTVFGFSDLQSKFVYDLRPSQQVSVSTVAGVSSVDRDDPGHPEAPAGGVNRSALLNVAWRSSIGHRTVLRQQASILAHDYRDRDQTGRPAHHGSDQMSVYRFDLTRAVFGDLFDAGVQVRRVRGSRRGSYTESPQAVPLFAPPIDHVGASWMEREGYASFGWRLASDLVVAPGVRVVSSTLVERGAVDRWVRAEWTPGSAWRMFASAGQVHQLADVERVQGRTPHDLRPERSNQLEVGVSRHVASMARVEVTLFQRLERDILRAPHAIMRDESGGVSDIAPTRDDNALTGAARGVELLVERRSAARLSGWATYSFGRSRQRDPLRGEHFRADFDQRHALAMTATTALFKDTRLGFTFRAGSDRPIPGYFVAREGRLYVSDVRNEATLPGYARFDVRAERVFRRGGRAVTVFADVLNLFDRSNYALSGGVVLRDTGEAVGVTERQFPRLLSAGLRIAF